MAGATLYQLVFRSKHELDELSEAKMSGQARKAQTPVPVAGARARDETTRGHTTDQDLLVAADFGFIHSTSKSRQDLDPAIQL